MNLIVKQMKTGDVSYYNDIVIHQICSYHHIPDPAFANMNKDDIEGDILQIDITYQHCLDRKWASRAITWNIPDNMPAKQKMLLLTELIDFTGKHIGKNTTCDITDILMKYGIIEQVEMCF